MMYFNNHDKLMLNIHKCKISKNVKSQNFLRGRTLKNPNYATLFSILHGLKGRVVIEQLKKKAGVLWLIHHYCATVLVQLQRERWGTKGKREKNVKGTEFQDGQEENFP